MVVGVFRARIEHAKAQERRLVQSEGSLDRACSSLCETDVKDDLVSFVHNGFAIACARH